jgi:hypothetical protein
MTRTIKISGNIATLLTIIGFLYPFCANQNIKFTILQIILILLAILLLIAYIVYEWFFNRPKKYKSVTDINIYMKNWVNKSGRTVILTRDLSWVNYDDIKTTLKTKAINKELIVCLPKNTDFTSELKDLGAEIYTYENLNFTPKSRFTFINYGTPYSKVAIGRKDKNHTHYIEEYSIENTVEYFLAEDLVNIIKSLKSNL